MSSLAILSANIFYYPVTMDRTNIRRIFCKKVDVFGHINHFLGIMDFNCDRIKGNLGIAHNDNMWHTHSGLFVVIASQIAN